MLRYDHRGHGGSAVPPGPYTIDQLVDDAARLIREWGRGPVVCVGLSMGGMVGQGLAIRHPELLRGARARQHAPRATREAAQADLGAAHRRRRAGGMAAIADMVIERYFSAGFRAGAARGGRAAPRATVLRSDPAGYVGVLPCARGGRLARPAARGATARRSSIAGAHDVGATPAMSQAIAERIRGAALVVLDDASHLSVAEQPALFAQLLRDFLAGLQPVAATP